MRAKYESPDLECVLAKHRPTITTITVASLESSELVTAGESGEISSCCPRIQELDISKTDLVSFHEVVRI
jgi:hypothetical protein